MIITKLSRSEHFTVFKKHTFWACHEQNLKAETSFTRYHRSTWALTSLKTSVALKSMPILQNLMTSNHRESDESKDHLKPTELDVVTMGDE
jgi:hypothetical protein